MINLQDFSSLPLYFDTKADRMVLGDGIECGNCNTVPLKNLTPGLLNKSLIYPTEVYEEHQNVRHQDHCDFPSDIDYDIIYLPEGFLGVEYIKSHIFYSPNGDSHGIASNIIEVFHGALTILMQRNTITDEPTFETDVSDGLVINVKQGQTAVLPKGYYYTFINTNESPVIFSRTHRNRAIIDYSLLRKEQGMAYYFIRKNAKCEIVKNPRYGNVPELRHMTPEETIQDFKFVHEKPIYSQLMQEMNMFLDMLWS